MGNAFSLFDDDINTILIAYMVYKEYGQEVYICKGLDGKAIKEITFHNTDVVFTKVNIFGKRHIVIDINIIKALSRNFDTKNTI